jgi:hypothetical protein
MKSTKRFPGSLYSSSSVLSAGGLAACSDQQDGEVPGGTEEQSGTTGGSATGDQGGTTAVWDFFNQF